MHDELAVGPSRPQEAIYPAIDLDARIIKVRARGVVSNRAASVAVELTLEGDKEKIAAPRGRGPGLHSVGRALSSSLSLRA